jgi:hypothetical protein
VVLRTELVDRVLLEAIHEVLDGRIMEAAVEKALTRLRAGQEQHLDHRTQIERELSLIETRLGHLVEALEGGGPIQTLIAVIRNEFAGDCVNRTAAVCDLGAHERRGLGRHVSIA